MRSLALTATVALVIGTFPIAGVAHATQIGSEITQVATGSSPGTGDVGFDDDGEVTVEAGSPESADTSPDATPAASYEFVPPPECSEKLIDKLWNAPDETKKRAIAEKLPAGCASDVYGVWVPAEGCWISLLAPPPAKDHPAWEGHDDGIILECVSPFIECDETHTTCVITDTYWSPTAPPGVPDPASLAQSAIDKMQLKPIRIGIEPSKGPGIVGMPSWMWASEPRDNEYGEKTASASAGGVTVTATATTQKVVWNLNGETTLECDAGTPYKVEYGTKDSECSHIYETQGEKHITARSTWQVSWESGDLGYEGTRELILEDIAEADIVIGEIQVLRQ